MEKPRLHPLEAARQETVGMLDLNVLGIEESYDAIVALLADALDAPICLLSIIDDNRQFFKSNIGLNASETSREISFCGRAIVQDHEIMVVQDARADPRFSDNPLVLEGPKIRFYAGAVIKAPNNLPVGDGVRN